MRAIANHLAPNPKRTRWASGVSSDTPIRPAVNWQGWEKAVRHRRFQTGEEPANP